MYLLDTDTLSNIIKRKPSEFLKKKMAKIPKALQHTSSITLGEIYYGAYRTNKLDKIITSFEENVLPNVNILAFDGDTSKIFGQLKAILEKKGIGCSEPDLRIASIAKQHKLTLITGNTRHFKNIPGLKIENWIKD
jgi:predicted nucleic acid-binding protein